MEAKLLYLRGYVSILCGLYAFYRPNVFEGFDLQYVSVFLFRSSWSSFCIYSGECAVLAPQIGKFVIVVWAFYMMGPCFFLYICKMPSPQFLSCMAIWALCASPYSASFFSTYDYSSIKCPRSCKLPICNFIMVSYLHTMAIYHFAMTLLYFARFFVVDFTWFVGTCFLGGFLGFRGCGGRKGIMCISYLICFLLMLHPNLYY